MNYNRNKAIDYIYTSKDAEISKYLKEQAQNIIRQKTRPANLGKLYNWLELFLSTTWNQQLILYGGTAIDMAIRLRDPTYAIYGADQDPDYDFYSTEPWNKSVELATLLFELRNDPLYQNLDFEYALAKPGLHLGTFKVYAGTNDAADITFVTSTIMNKIINDNNCLEFEVDIPDLNTLAAGLNDDLQIPDELRNIIRNYNPADENRWKPKVKLINQYLLMSNLMIEFAYPIIDPKRIPDKTYERYHRLKNNYLLPNMFYDKLLINNFNNGTYGLLRNEDNFINLIKIKNYLWFMTFTTILFEGINNNLGTNYDFIMGNYAAAFAYICIFNNQRRNNFVDLKNKGSFPSLDIYVELDDNNHLGQIIDYLINKINNIMDRIGILRYNLNQNDVYTNQFLVNNSIGRGITIDIDVNGSISSFQLINIFPIRLCLPYHEIRLNDKEINSITGLGEYLDKDNCHKIIAEDFPDQNLWDYSDYPSLRDYNNLANYFTKKIKIVNFDYLKMIIYADLGLLLKNKFLTESKHLNFSLFSQYYNFVREILINDVPINTNNINVFGNLFSLRNININAIPDNIILPGNLINYLNNQGMSMSDFVNEITNLLKFNNTLFILKTIYEISNFNVEYLAVGPIESTSLISLIIENIESEELKNILEEKHRLIIKYDFKCLGKINTIGNVIKDNLIKRRDKIRKEKKHYITLVNEDNNYLKQNPILTYNTPIPNPGPDLDPLNYLDATYNHHYKQYCRSNNINQCSFPCSKLNRCCLFKNEFELYSPGENLLRDQEETNERLPMDQLLARLQALAPTFVARQPAILGENQSCEYLGNLPNYDQVPN